MNAVSEAGERQVIETILKSLDFPSNLPIPFGDDVSGVYVGRHKVAVLKTDMLVGKTDIPPSMSFWQAGRKAVVMNISDFAAKGVKPMVLLVSLGIPSNFLVKDVKQLAKGLNMGAREFGAYVIGGDTNEACDLIISCSLFGVVDKGFLMLRSGAKPGDIVAVTGFFGKTKAGLKILLEGISVSPKVRKRLLDAVLMPMARLKEGLTLSRANVVSASIDSSDGLAWSLYELAQASNVGFVIDKLPIAPEVLQFAKQTHLDPADLTLYGGEEYELVLTIKPKMWQKAFRAVKKIGGTLLRIGEVTEEREMLFHWKGKTFSIEPRGWEHFKT